MTKTGRKNRSTGRALVSRMCKNQRDSSTSFLIVLPGLKSRNRIFADGETACDCNIKENRRKTYSTDRPKLLKRP